MNAKNVIGPQVRRARFARGWSQETLAIRLQLAGLDMSRSGVSKIEAQLRQINDRELIALVLALKVSIQDLIPDTSKVLPCLSDHLPISLTAP